MDELFESNQILPEPCHTGTAYGHETWATALSEMSQLELDSAGSIVYDRKKTMSHLGADSAKFQTEPPASTPTRLR